MVNGEPRCGRCKATKKGCDRRQPICGRCARIGLKAAECIPEDQTQPNDSLLQSQFHTDPILSPPSTLKLSSMTSQQTVAVEYGGMSGVESGFNDLPIQMSSEAWHGSPASGTVASSLSSPRLPRFQTLNERSSSTSSAPENTDRSRGVLHQPMSGLLSVTLEPSYPDSQRQAQMAFESVGTRDYSKFHGDECEQDPAQQKALRATPAEGDMHLKLAKQASSTVTSLKRKASDPLNPPTLTSQPALPQGKKPRLEVDSGKSLNLSEALRCATAIHEAERAKSIEQFHQEIVAIDPTILSNACIGIEQSMLNTKELEPLGLADGAIRQPWR